jgi:pyruvate/2-oxoacid:ferredoxin oxidoreductase beta subunit
MCRPQVICACPDHPSDSHRRGTVRDGDHGARYLHILVPCPLGWCSSPADTVKVARLATESGLFPVFETEAGQVTSSTPIRHQVPVTDYMRIQAAADRNIRRFGLAPLGTERAEVAVPGKE